MLSKKTFVLGFVIMILYAVFAINEGSAGGAATTAATQTQTGLETLIRNFEAREY